MNTSSIPHDDAYNDTAALLGGRYHPFHVLRYLQCNEKLIDDENYKAPFHPLEVI
jgi:hypothetical protein